MRDAFGGEFMIRLFLVFLVIYIGFIAIALNYAKAFRVKNSIIEYIESNEIANIARLSAEEYEKMERHFTDEIMSQNNYNINANCGATHGGDGRELVYHNNGICIYRYAPNSNETNKKGVYYQVNTYFGWNIQFLNMLLYVSGREPNDGGVGTWKVSGETRLIVGDNI